MNQSSSRIIDSCKQDLSGRGRFVDFLLDDTALTWQWAASTNYRFAELEAYRPEVEQNHTHVHPELMARMRPVRVPRKLPVVRSPDEVRRLIAAAGNLKHQTALSVAYGAGLRASEVVARKVSDIDSQRMTLRIEQGKGPKDRYAVILSGSSMNALPRAKAVEK
ncbi:integrase [Paraburkholderia sp. 35.1]